MTWYGLASYSGRGGRRSAIVFDERVFDLEAVHGVVHPGESPPAWSATVEQILESWGEAAPALDALAEAAAPMAARSDLDSVAVSHVALTAPVAPRRIFAAAANYVAHADEMGTVLADKAESNPYMFMKPDTAVIGPGGTVILPPQSEQVDWEVELGVVIGRAGRGVAVDEALDYVAGYTVVNDVSARDLNVRDDFPFKFDWFRGKGFDTFAPIGPWIVPGSCIADPQNLDLTLSVNGETMQDASTGGMIFDVREQISYLSAIVSLRPGDVIATGTPTGVGMSRGVFLAPGDVMVATIEGIGSLENPVAASP